jgi:hypothetical protein
VSAEWFDGVRAAGCASAVGLIVGTLTWVMLTAMASLLRISVSSVASLETRGRWRVTWSITNMSDSELVIVDAWVPHGRFRGEGHVPLGVTVAPGSVFDLALDVSSDEPAGTIVKNAFLILRVSGYRVFTRMRIQFTASGMTPIIESVTTMGPDEA